MSSKVSRTKTTDVLIEQYKELCSDGRHYDQKLWIIQSAGYTTSAVFYIAIFQVGQYAADVRLLLALVNTLVFFGFLLQYVKDRSFQLENQATIARLLEEMPEMIEANQYSGRLKGSPKDRWFIKLFRKVSAANFSFYVMLLILCVHGLVSMFIALQVLGVLS